MFKAVFAWVILRGIIDWLTGREVWRKEPIRLNSVTANRIQSGAISSAHFRKAYRGA